MNSISSNASSSASSYASSNSTSSYASSNSSSYASSNSSYASSNSSSYAFSNSTSSYAYSNSTSSYYYSNYTSYTSSILLDFNSANYVKIVQSEVPDNNTKSWLMGFVKVVYDSDLEEKYEEPMVWIGVYIALASLFCILAMVADLLHGFRSRKLWFPCKYFTINAAFLTVIGVSMKLPMDLSGSMPGVVDQVAKLGSLAFMCTMMGNLLPWLATMDSNEMLANVTALGVLVITLVVNVCIQIQTGVVACNRCSGRNMIHEMVTIVQIPQMVLSGEFPDPLLVLSDVSYSTVATLYVIVLLVLLILYVSSFLAILKSKQILESRYQQAHETVIEYTQPSTGELLTVEKLQEHVSKYWIMAGSGNPQFVVASFATTTASGAICVLTAILHTLTMGWTISSRRDYGSAYDWSTPLILMVQFIGVLLGTVAPLCRCLASLCFKVSIKSIRNHIKVFQVESYWTEKLCDWKYSSIPFSSHKRKVIKSIILDFSINLQKGVVVVCKIIALNPMAWLLGSVFRSSGKRMSNKMEMRTYVLQLTEEMELGDRTLEGLSKSLNRLIEKSGKKQPKNLMNLINTKSTKGFQGVRKFDNNDHHRVQCSPSSVEDCDCWSLAIVTLATIAVTLRKIKKVEVDSLLKSVREGLDYVALVENTLNATDDYVKIQKAAERLWQEVDVCHKWLGIRLKNMAYQVNTHEDATLQVVKLFNEKAKKIKAVGNPKVDSKFSSICANSMSRVTETIIAYHEENNKESFDALISSRIADIMAACLTNLPQVIATKCHTSAIEKREASVEAAAKLLGETKEIIKTLQEPSRHVSSMKSEDMPFIHKWHVCSFK